jgi:hypothetical protein
MADIKISDLTVASAAAGTMQIEVNDSLTSKSLSVALIKAYVLPSGSITTTEIATSAVNLTTQVTGSLPLLNGGTGGTTSATALVGLGARTSATGSSSTPVGTTAQRDVTPLTGYFRYNTTTVGFEGYNGTAWGNVGGGATGGGTDQVFVLNSQVITTAYTVPVGKSASSVGAITINSGIAVTVSSGSRWAVL